MNMKLFYVRGSTDEGINQDLLVVAEKAEDCVPMWRKTYELEHSPMWVGEVPGVVPAPGTQPGPIDWGRINPTSN